MAALERLLHVLSALAFTQSFMHAYSYIQQIGRSAKSMNPKNTKKSPIHKNACANITCDFGDGDINRSRSRLPHRPTPVHTYIVTSIIIRLSHYIIAIIDNVTYHKNNYR